MHQITYTPERLTSKTATLALGFDVVSIFSADDGSSMVLERLKDFGVKYIALRSTGYDNVNLSTAKKLGIEVANTPGYSPYAIAEHAVTLLLALNRKLICANEQVTNYNFSLSNLVGFDLNQKKAGIVGIGRIGTIIAKIMHGFGCKIIGNDIYEDKEVQEKYQVDYTDLENLCKQSDIIFLSTPLNSKTHHLIDNNYIEQMKKEAIVINIARGAIVHTKDIIEALLSKRIAGYGADVYEYEDSVFFYDRSNEKPQDKLLQQLLDLPNVILTPHQAFATKEALTNIAEMTFYNINCWQQHKSGNNKLSMELVR